MMLNASSLFVVSAIVALDPMLGDAVMKCLEEDERAMVGDICDSRVPVCVVTTNKKEDESFWQQLARHPGVLQIQFVSAHVDTNESVRRAQS